MISFDKDSVNLEYYENKNTELYMRYLTTEDMELTSAYEYDADKFLRTLKSENEFNKVYEVQDE